MRNIPWPSAVLLLVIFLATIGFGGYVFWMAGAIR
jgi:hypothetical protein